MAAIDLILLAILAYALIRGMMRGFVMEMAGLFGIVISLFVAKNFSDLIMSKLLEAFGMQQETSHLVSFFIVFLLAMIGVRFLAALVNRLVSFAMLGWLNKLLGGIFSAVKYALILGVALYGFDKLNDYAHLISEETIAQSKLYEPIKSLSGIVFKQTDKITATETPEE